MKISHQTIFRINLDCMPDMTCLILRCKNANPAMRYWTHMDFPFCLLRVR